MDDISLRMKEYEKSLDVRIVPHVPTIIRVDGKAFHTYTRGLQRPYDYELQQCFYRATQETYRSIHYDMAYGQSDEVSFLIYNPDTFTQEDFQGRLFKLSSIVSSVFTAWFNHFATNLKKQQLGFFDGRVFQLPRQEVINYFIWRQQDATRNSIQMLGQAHFSPKQLHGKNCNEIQEMLMTQKNLNWNDTPVQMKRGWVVDKNIFDSNIPIFTEDRNYIEKYLLKKEEAV